MTKREWAMAVFAVAVFFVLVFTVRSCNVTEDCMDKYLQSAGKHVQNDPKLCKELFWWP